MLRTLFAVVLVAATVAATAAAQGAGASASRPAAGWWSDVFSPQPVPLAKLRATPDLWRDVPVTFVVQFRRSVQHDEVFFTRFDPERWTSLDVWPDEAPLWEKPAWDADFGFLFVRRSSPLMALATDGAAYRRLAVTGIVRDVIKGEPWIEVTGLREVPGHLTEPALVHLVKGLMLRDIHRLEAAATEFAAADSDVLPTSVRVLAHRECGVALLGVGRLVASETHLRTAATLDPSDALTVRARRDLATARSKGGRGEDGEHLAGAASRPAATSRPAAPPSGGRTVLIGTELHPAGGG